MCHIKANNSGSSMIRVRTSHAKPREGDGSPEFSKLVSSRRQEEKKQIHQKTLSRRALRRIKLVGTRIKTAGEKGLDSFITFLQQKRKETT